MLLTTSTLSATVGTPVNSGPAIVTVAVRKPLAPVGAVYPKSIRQLAPPARLNGGALGQFPFVTENSLAFGPLAVIELTCNADVPGFEIVKLPVVLPPTACVLNRNDVGVTFNVVPATVPLSGISCGLSIALSVRTNCAFRVPVALAPGLKLTSNWQLDPPDGTGVVHPGPPFDTSEKAKSVAFAPLIATVETVSGKSPLLDTNTSKFAPVVPAACDGNTIGFGATDTVAPLPVPAVSVNV